MADRLPEVVRAIRGIYPGENGPYNAEAFYSEVYRSCECGGWDSRMVPITGGPGIPARTNHARRCPSPRNPRFTSGGQP